LDNQTGEPVTPANLLLIPTRVIRLIDRFERQYQCRDYNAMRSASEQWVLNHPALTFDWSAQFDDAKVRQAYENLSKHEACEFAIHLLTTPPPDDDSRRALAERLVDFAEDQFVVWEKPPPLPPRQGLEQLDSRHWITPCSLEQYAMFEPVSGSSAWMIMTYLSAYHATGKSIYLAKAQSLGNALTVAQQKAGGGERYPTRMIEQDMQYWLNSTVNCAKAMQELARVSGEQK
jgi:hypothetical protein